MSIRRWVSRKSLTNENENNGNDEAENVGASRFVIRTHALAKPVQLGEDAVLANSLVRVKRRKIRERRASTRKRREEAEKRRESRGKTGRQNEDGGRKRSWRGHEVHSRRFRRAITFPRYSHIPWSLRAWIDFLSPTQSLMVQNVPRGAVMIQAVCRNVDAYSQNVDFSIHYTVTM